MSTGPKFIESWWAKFLRPVVRNPTMANPRLNLNPSSCFFCSKEIFPSIFSRHFNIQKSYCRRKELTGICILKSSDLNSNLAYILGYLWAARPGPLGRFPALNRACGCGRSRGNSGFSGANCPSNNLAQSKTSWFDRSLPEEKHVFVTDRCWQGDPA